MTGSPLAPDEGPPASYVVNIDGGLTARVRFGSGVPVLWIHGYTLDSGIWSELWDLLPGWSHLGIDLPGHGGSPPLGQHEDLPALADRIGRLTVEVGINHVVALSFGTVVAVEVALRYPEQISTLVLGAPSLAGGPHDPATRDRQRDLLRQHQLLGVGPHLRALWMEESSEVFRHARRRPELWHRLWDTVGRHRWPELRDAGIRRLTAHQHDSRQLQRIRARTLVLVGEHEMTAFKATAAQLVAEVPGCRRVDVPQAGHLCLLEAPRTAASAIAAHLDATLRSAHDDGVCERMGDLRPDD